MFGLGKVFTGGFWSNGVVKGVMIGVGISAAGFVLYKKNEDKVDDFLRRHGINVSTPTADFDKMSVEDLMRTKETIEELIAEKELDEQTITVEVTAEEAQSAET